MCELHGVAVVAKAFTDQPEPVKRHVEQFERMWKSMSSRFERDLLALLKRTKAECVKRYALLSAVELRLSKRVSESDVDKIIPEWFYDELTIIGKTHIALGMASGARQEARRSAKQRALLTKFKALPESAESIPGFLKLPKKTADAIANTVNETFDKPYWKKHATAQRKFISRAIKDSAKKGWTPRETATFIMEDSGGAFNRAAARRIVQTETTGAINGGAYAVRTKDLNEQLIDGEEWLSTLDQNLRPTHHAAHKQETKMVGGQWVSVKGNTVLQTGQRGFMVGGEFARFPGDPNLSAGERINCLHPSQVVEGQYVAAVEARYSGEMVEIETASGRRLVLTVQHPVSTPDGWVSAGELKEGDAVLRSTEDFKPSAGKHEAYYPTTVTELFRAFSLFRLSPLVRSHAEDFYGDAKFFKTDVNIASFHGELLDAKKAELLNRIGQFSFVIEDASGISLASRGTLPECCDGVGGVPASLMRRLYLPSNRDRTLRLDTFPLSRFCVGARRELDAVLFAEPEQVLSGNAVTVGDDLRSVTGGKGIYDGGNIGLRQLGSVVSDVAASVDENAANLGSAAPLTPTDLRDRFSALVAADDVITVKRFRYDGHVYDLQSSGEPYILADGVLISNCRCTTIPIVDLSTDVPVADPIGLKTPSGVADAPKLPKIKPKPAKTEPVVEAPAPAQPAFPKDDFSAVTDAVPVLPSKSSKEKLFDAMKEGQGPTKYSHLPFDAAEKASVAKNASDMYAQALQSLGHELSHTHSAMLSNALDHADDMIWSMHGNDGKIKVLATVQSVPSAKSLVVKQIHAVKEFDVPIQAVISDLLHTAQRRGFKRLMLHKGSHVTKQYNFDVLEQTGLNLFQGYFRVTEAKLDVLAESLEKYPGMTMKALQDGTFTPIKSTSGNASLWSPLAEKVKPKAKPAPAQRPATPSGPQTAAPKREAIPSRDDASVLADEYVNHSGTDGFPSSLNDVKVVKQLGGSTGAQLVEDASGARFVLKDGANVGHLLDEYVAEEAYRGVGVAIPDSRLLKDANGKVWKLSKFIDGDELGSLSGEAYEAAASRIRDDFAADALMSNWDTIGLSQDNVLIDKAGKPWRIDVGGSLRYRAQGGDKGEAFKRTVGELWTMGNENSSAAPVFKPSKLSFQDKHESAKRILSHLDTAPKRERWLNTFKDTQLRHQMKNRLASLEDIVETTEDFVGDQFKWEYVDDVQRHRIGLQEKELSAIYEQELTNRGVEVFDADGKMWDHLRDGEGNATEQFGKYLDEIDPKAADVFEHWCKAQSGSSWSDASQAFKTIFVESRNASPDAYRWASSYEMAQSHLKYLSRSLDVTTDVLKQTMAASHANSFELVRRMKFGRNDLESKSIRLIRTHDASVLKREYGISTRKGAKNQQIKEGAIESSSAFEDVYIGSSDLHTEYTVPHTRVINSYLLNKPKSGEKMLYGDFENEFLVNLEGLPLDVIKRK
jgi:hypothetical protein